MKNQNSSERLLEGQLRYVCIKIILLYSSCSEVAGRRVELRGSRVGHPDQKASSPGLRAMKVISM